MDYSAWGRFVALGKSYRVEVLPAGSSDFSLIIMTPLVSALTINPLEDFVVGDGFDIPSFIRVDAILTLTSPCCVDLLPVEELGTVTY